jgi:hypothetical protein
VESCLQFREYDGLVKIVELDDYHIVRFYNVVSGDEVNIELNEPQWAAFMEYRKGTKFVALGGGVRGGKSFFTVGFMPIYLSLKYGGNVGIISRNTFGEIENLIYEEILKKFFLDKILTKEFWKYDKKHHRIHFSGSIGGSTIIFQNVMDTQNRKINLNRALMGIGLGWFAVDQSEFVSESDFNTYIHRLSLNCVPKRVGFVNFNPRGHDWNYKTFINPATKRPDSICIQNKTEDNSKNLPQDYLDNIKTMHKSWVSRWVDGSFDSWEGLIYPQWDEKVHIVPPLNKDMLKKHKVYVTIDYGLNNPTSIGFWTILDGGYVLRFDEHYERGLFIPDVYEAAYRILTERLGVEKVTGYTIMDRSILHKRDSNRGITAATIFSELDKKHFNFGLLPYPSTGDVLTGINRMGAYLAVDKNLMNPFTKELGSPRMFISQNCEKFRWEIGNYIWAESPNLDVDIETSPDFKNLKEEPLAKNNHAMDESRYFIMTLPPAPITGVLNNRFERKPLSEVTKY